MENENVTKGRRQNEIDSLVKDGTDRDLAGELVEKVNQHSRFEDSFEVRCMKETIRTNKIRKELEDAEEWYISEIQYRKNRNNQLKKLKKNKDVKNIEDMINEIKDVKFVKKRKVKAINIILALLLIAIMYYFLYGVDFNMRD